MMNEELRCTYCGEVLEEDNCVVFNNPIMACLGQVFCDEECGNNYIESK
jgi:hypothetical protein